MCRWRIQSAEEIGAAHLSIVHPVLVPANKFPINPAPLPAALFRSEIASGATALDLPLTRRRWPLRFQNWEIPIVEKIR